MLHLQKHSNGGGNKADRDYILENDEKLAEHHLRLFAESPAHHFDRFGIRDDNRRQQPGNKSDKRDQKNDNDPVQRGDHFRRINLFLYQIAGIRSKEESQEQTDTERNSCQQSRLYNQPRKQFFA